MCISFGLGIGSLHSRFDRGDWTVDFSVGALGLVFLALFWPGLDGLYLWVWTAWASLVTGVWGVLLCC